MESKFAISKEDVQTWGNSSWVTRVSLIVSIVALIAACLKDAI